MMEQRISDSQIQCYFGGSPGDYIDVDDIENLVRDLRDTRQALAASEAREKGLREALAHALEGLEEMFPYVPEYFRDKWSHQDYIDHAKAALTPTPIESTKGGY